MVLDFNRVFLSVCFRVGSRLVGVRVKVRATNHLIHRNYVVRGIKNERDSQS